MHPVSGSGCRPSWRSLWTERERFIDHVGKLAEVTEIHAVAGDFDFLLKVSVKDMADFKRLIWQEFDRLAEIKTIRSTMVFDSPKISYGYLP
jgi:Lrp/AsnC family transcriptional regulator, leucine-responsive regulatory protein